MDYLAGLNVAQKTAVQSQASVVQILAPPGSGKTTTLTSRVAHLVCQQHYSPWNVICLTFTIKSAREMRERLARLTGDGLESKIVLGTFHSVCRRYLCSYGHLIGIRKGFGIADGSDSQNIISRIVKRSKLNIDPKAARARISSCKARGAGPDQLRQNASAMKKRDQRELLTVYEGYEDHLAASNLLDYDDLLLRCADLLRAHPTCVSNVEAVLVDEFQDTNVIQFELMRLFAAKRNRVTTVGDPDQSIYGWRSAEVQNLTRMRRLFPDTLVVHLEDNYRSSGAILHAALEVIQQDEARPAKPLLPTHCPGSIPALRRLPSAETEARWIVSEVRRCVCLTGGLLALSDFAILLRSAALSRHIEGAMGKAGMPYRMVGGFKFFDRVEIKVLLDYLRVIAQPENTDALARILNVPCRGIGATTVKALLEETSERRTTLWSLLGDAVRGHRRRTTRLTKSQEQGLASLLDLVSALRERLHATEDALLPQQLLETVVERLGFRDHLERTHGEDHETRWANVEELIAQAADCSPTAHEAYEDESLPEVEGLAQESASGPEEALSRFLANVALNTERQSDEGKGEDAGKERITISTIHAAKGLEWPVVFVPSAFDGSIPHSRAEDRDEERRLLYVAMTRAQALLYLSCPRKDSRLEETALSPFLSAPRVARQLAEHGPDMTPDLVYDMSQILRRPCPSWEKLLEGSREATNVQDNLWPPSNGEGDAAETVAIGWTRQNPSGCRHEPKRRRVAAAAGPRPPPNRTLSDTSAFATGPTNPSRGFVSAASQLRLAKGHDGDEDEEATTKTAAKTIKGTKPGKATKGARNQGSLLSFFGARSGSGSARQEDAKGRTGRTPHPEAEDARARPDDDGAGTPGGGAYVFLSSSPPPEGQADPPAFRAVGPKPLPAPQQQQQQQQQQRRRRTLGVRRSMEGWAARGGGFTRPRMTG